MIHGALRTVHDKLAALQSELFGRRDGSGAVIFGEGGLAQATSVIGWDRGDAGPDEVTYLDPKSMGAKPIHAREYMRAFIIATAIAQAHPYLDKPVPGADPEGFIWLTYRQGPERVFALECRQPDYVWTQRDQLGNLQKFSSPSLNDVVHAMGTVFRRVEG